MTTITKNEKTGRVIIEEDGYSTYYNALVQGAIACKVSVSAEDYAEIEAYYNMDAFVGTPEFFAALAACKSYHVIRKERVID